MTNKRSILNSASAEPVIEQLHHCSYEISQKIYAEIEADEGVSIQSLAPSFTQIGLDDSSSIFVMSINTGSRYLFFLDGNQISMSARTRKEEDLLFIDKLYIMEGLECSELEDILNTADVLFGKGRVKVALTARNSDPSSREEYIKCAKKCGFTIDGEFAVKD